MQNTSRMLTTQLDTSQGSITNINCMSITQKQRFSAFPQIPTCSTY